MGGILLAIPGIGGETVPIRVRAGLALATGVVLLPVVPPTGSYSGGGETLGLVSLTMLVGTEFLVGLVATLVMRLLLETFALAGEIMGLQMGLSFAQQVDPSTRQPMSMIGQLMSWILLIVFLNLGGHYLLLRLAAGSFSAFPPGSLILTQQTAEGILQWSEHFFVDAFRLALPVICIVLIVDIGLALMTKFGQEFQVLMLAFPIRIGLGLFVITASLPVIVPFARESSVEAIDNLARILGT
jgi:flagellar biosynthetic protein FliR